MTSSINEYQLLEQLGQGSFGTVRRASQVHACGDHSFVVSAQLQRQFLACTSHMTCTQAIKTMSKKRLKRKVKVQRQVSRSVLPAVS
jgi:serine/threonine protein kinase